MLRFLTGKKVKADHGNRFYSITGNFSASHSPLFTVQFHQRLGLLVLIFHAGGTDGKEAFFYE